MCSPDCFLACLAVLFPPLPVWVKRGICSADSLINIALCMLGYLPGLIHAWYIISKYPDEELYEPLEAESHYQRVYYFPAPNRHASQSPSPRPPPHAPTPPPHGYATFNQPAPQQYAAPPHPQSPGPLTPTRYASYPQQTPAPGPSSGTAQGEGPPTYADAVRGDYKVQTHD
ncbi:hypothetical protein BDZ91DRAFT_730805 [Kalaharituber pfeilii]|nr:hypothetical protein BDZ91DRAFT_730805 [Kalaharituber pfeilii]